MMNLIGNWGVGLDSNANYADTLWNTFDLNTLVSHEPETIMLLPDVHNNDCVN